MTTTIIHYLHKSDRNTFLRCLFNHDVIKDLLETGNIKYIVVLDYVYLQYIDTLDVDIIKYKNLTDLNNIKNFQYIFYTNLNDSYKIINYLNPKSIILSINPQNIYIKTLFSKIICRNIFYIHHGIFDNTFKYENLKKNWSPNIKYIVGDIYAYSILKKHNKKVYKINGLPQFECLLTNNIYNKNDICKKYNLDFDKKLVLIINGTSCHINYVNVIKKLSNIINEIYPNSIIFLKNKRTQSDKDYKNLKIKNLILIDSNTMIYNYLNSDINIIIDGGTSFMESLLVNKNTILYPISNKITNNFNLMISKNDKGIKNYLENIKKTKYDINYDNDVQKYIKNIIGNNIKYVSSDIIEIVKK